MGVTSNAEGAYPKRALNRQQGEFAEGHWCRILKVELKFIGRERRENLGKERKHRSYCGTLDSPL